MKASPILIPRWGILLIDLLIALSALVAAYQLRFNFNVPALEVDLLLPVLPVYILVRGASFWMAGIHRIMVRHTSTEDAKRIFLTVLTGSLVFALLNAVRFLLIDGTYFLPITIIVIDAMGTLIGMITSRILFKLLHLRSKDGNKQEVRVLIFGAGEAGLITKRTIERESSVRSRVVAFVDDDTARAGKRLEGSPILHTSALKERLAKGDVDQVIIAIARTDPEHRRNVVDRCLEAGIQVRSIPPPRDWIDGKLDQGQIREIRIEDLLGRAVIELDQEQVHAHFSGRVVLVSGAAGSIGSELVRQLIAMDLKRMVLVDIAESALYDLQMELQARKVEVPFNVLVGDVRDAKSMRRIFAAYRPEVVFHAAAYKHVPLMEAAPREALHTNVGGTQVMADLAVEFAVERFVLISSDKAVNPTSVMGTSKRIAERYVQSVRLTGGTIFVTTRFGNVLGSSGSVVPLFRKQIAAGGPVTVTHEDVTRFFMTIPEACRLVLEAATMGEGGEVYVFDMGSAVAIKDLAERMIRLSGHEPGRDIAIVYTGLRPGEKLYEELLANEENTRPTHNPRIMIGKVDREEPAEVRNAINALLVEADDLEEAMVLHRMTGMVPEYQGGSGLHRTFGAAIGTHSGGTAEQHDAG